MRRFVLLTALAFPVLPLPPAVAFAQTVAASPPVAAPPVGDGHHGPMAQKFQAGFNAANTTHDGHLTLAQAKAAKMCGVSSNFAAIDVKKRGYVTLDDVMAWHLEQRAKEMAQKAAALRAQD